MFWSALLNALFDAFGDFLNDLIAGFRRDQANQAVGAASTAAGAATETLKQTTEIRDAEERNRARPDDELAGRLSGYSPKPGP